MGIYINNVNCSDEFIKLLIEVIGYPIIDENTIFDIFSKEYIKENIISLSLETYYNYFPIIKTFTMSSNTKINSPYENVLGILHYNFVQNSNTNSDFNLNTGNAFYTASLISQVVSGSNYGTPFNYNAGVYTQYQQRFLSDSMKNMNGGRQHSVRYYEQSKLFTSISKAQGKFNVTVGCYSNNVDDIENKNKTKFMDLCKAELGFRFAKNIKLIDSDLPLQIDADDLFEDSKDLKEKTIEWFEQNSMYMVMK